jgi:hypothetical protein
MTSAATLSHEELTRRFEDGSLAPGAFKHHEHMRVAWWMLREEPLMPAMRRFCDAIQHFVRTHGLERKYHETISIALLLLIHEGMLPDESFESFEQRNRELFEDAYGVLARYYDWTTLDSDDARARFLLPERRGDGAAP